MPVLTANKAFILGYTNEENSYNKPSIIFDDFTLDRKYVDFPYMLKSSAIKILTSKNQHNLRFLFERLNSTRFEVLGHARHYISVVQNTTTLCPSVDEEVCISNLLTKFDEIITLHQRKLEHLNLKKKALLQKLFPKDGERYPELRFPGFTDAWEQRKLGAMCSLFIDGDWIESKDQSNEGIRLIQTGNIGVGKFIDKPENKKWISHSTFNNLRCKELLDGDILISRLPQPAGRACIVNTNNEKWITAVDCTIVRLLDQYSNKFILQSLCTYNYFHLIDSFLAGGTRQRVSRSNLSDINIMSPKKIEQDKIGLFFEYVDNLITLHQQEPFLCGNSINGGVELC